MLGRRARARTRTSRVIRAHPRRLYGAFMNPASLVSWLPPAEMDGVILDFDARVGGGYRMSLFYPPEENVFRGKTRDNEDQVKVRFVELVPERKIVERVSFVTKDPKYMGEMTLTVTFDPVAAGTNVTLLFENLPPGLRPEENEKGTEISLEQLAQQVE